MQRRDFIALLGGVFSWPFLAHAEQKAMPVIGFLGTTSPGPFAPFVAAFLQGLSETGYVEGQNVAIEYHWAENRFDRLPELAADLVRRKVDVIATSRHGGTPGEGQQDEERGEPFMQVHCTKTASIRLGSLFMTLPTRGLTGQHVMFSAE